MIVTFSFIQAQSIILFARPAVCGTIIHVQNLLLTALRTALSLLHLVLCATENGTTTSVNSEECEACDEETTPVNNNECRG